MDESQDSPTGRPRSCCCGECAKCKHADYMREWYRRQTPEKRREILAGRDLEKTRATDRRRYRRNRDARLEVLAERDRGDRREETARYRAENPEKWSAHQAVQRALRSGRLTTQPCEGCGSERVHAHHDDYSKPLDVRWLCPACHGAEHRQYVDEWDEAA